MRPPRAYSISPSFAPSLDMHQRLFRGWGHPKPALKPTPTILTYSSGRLRGPHPRNNLWCISKDGAKLGEIEYGLPAAHLSVCHVRCSLSSPPSCPSTTKQRPSFPRVRVQAPSGQEFSVQNKQRRSRSPSKFTHSLVKPRDGVQSSQKSLRSLNFSV